MNKARILEGNQMTRAVPKVSERGFQVHDLPAQNVIFLNVPHMTLTKKYGAISISSNSRHISIVVYLVYNVSNVEFNR